MKQRIFDELPTSLGARMAGGVAALMLCTSLVACGGKPAESTQQSTQEASEVSATSEVSAQSASDESQASTTTTVEEEPRLDTLVLVNKTHALPEGWEDKLDLCEEVNTKGYTQALDRIAYEPFKELQADLASQGITVELNSCYRSIAEQQAIVDQFTEDYGEDYVREFVAVPGYSEHHTGLAADIYLIIDGVPQLTNEEIYAAQDTWDIIHATMVDYGFILRYTPDGEEITGYTYEPWHIRYVGTEAAHAIMDAGLTLEEYLGEVD